MAIENPYKWDSERLVTEFMNASARAGASNSGLMISPSAGSDWERARYLKGVVIFQGDNDATADHDWDADDRRYAIPLRFAAEDFEALTEIEA